MSIRCLAILIISSHFWFDHVSATDLEDDPRLSLLMKNASSSLASGHTGNSTWEESQNMFQSSISCGHSEFYVQLTFNRPFRGLVYAYRQIPSIDPILGHYYPVQILESCTLRGNGASVIYLELSFFSECVEKLPLTYEVSDSGNNLSSSRTVNGISESTLELQQSTQSNETTTFDQEYPPHFKQQFKFSLDGFNFRRALNEEKQASVNISKNELYQLSLYIQNDANIEQKTDSKVTVQCSSQVTRNIAYEQNLSNEYSRKVDPGAGIPTGKTAISGRSIVPAVNLSVRSFNFDHNETDAANLIESRMDILRGRIPFLKLVNSSIELGDDVTLIIRTKQTDYYDTRVANCFAYDEHDRARLELTNHEGCSLDVSVIPSFKVMHHVGSSLVMHYTSFAAFKFPGSHYLNLQCTLLVCRKTCPKPSCETTKQRA